MESSNAEDSGRDNLSDPHKSSGNETDPPVANGTEFTRKSIPKTPKEGFFKLTQEALVCMLQSAKEFVWFIMSEADERRQLDHRSVQTSEDILAATDAMGFGPYVGPLKWYLERHPELVKDENDPEPDVDNVSTIDVEPIPGTSGDPIQNCSQFEFVAVKSEDVDEKYCEALENVCEFHADMFLLDLSEDELEILVHEADLSYQATVNSFGTAATLEDPLASEFDPLSLEDEAGE